ncbi:MAG: electron transport complex subunit RsxC [Gammaproteobacteria bacterium AqS3]|nr:electron transport complex subunit RsxC [Gammaproteobacteria bacterium AqS3]
MSLVRIEPVRPLRGIAMPGHKERSLTRPIELLEAPGRLYLRVDPETVCVDLEGAVLGGELLGRCQGVGVHAPTSGRILAIAEAPMCHPAQLPSPHLVLEPDGRDAFRRSEPWTRLPEPAEIFRRIESAGLAGLGGAGFPTALKLKSGAQRTEALIVNAVECEPHITADAALLREHSDTVLRGAALVRRLLGARDIIIAVENSMPEAIAAIERTARDFDEDFRLCVLPALYPAGSEKQLTEALLGREIPAGGLPADIGALCLNVGTLAALATAVYQDAPLTHRITTITGSAVPRPGNYCIPIGAPIEDLLCSAGCAPEDVARLIVGGSMMGYAISDLRTPASKTVNCLIADDAGAVAPQPPQQPCIRCGFCVEVCPVSLLPQQLYAYSHSQQYERLEQHRLADCIECGACSWVCPSKIPLVEYYRQAKRHLHSAERERLASDAARVRFESRNERLSALAQAREAELLERRRARKLSHADRSAIAEAQQRASAAAAAADGDGDGDAAAEPPQPAGDVNQLGIALRQAQVQLAELQRRQAPERDIQHIQGQIEALGERLRSAASESESGSGSEPKPESGSEPKSKSKSGSS